MIDSSEIDSLADLSLAAYTDFGTLPTGGLTGKLLSEALYAFDKNSWPLVRADEFALHWKVVAFQPNTSSGFSATVFERIDPKPGEPLHVLAIRGTEASQTIDDLLDADLSDLVANGLAWGQTLDLYNWWNKLITPKGSHYDTVAAVAISPAFAAARLALGFSDVIIGAISSYQIVHSNSTDQGLELFSPGERLDVTRHSLGGHLATAFSRLFPSNTSNVVTINGAGYSLLGNISGNTSRVFSNLGGAASFDSSKILNIYGDAGLNIVTQNFGLGLTQPGGHIPVFIEDYDPFSNGFGHGVIQMAQSLDVQELLRRLEGSNAPSDPSLMLARYRPVMDGAANLDGQTFERVVESVRRLLLVPLESAMPTGNNEVFYSRLSELETSAKFTSIAGKVNVVRSEDVSLESLAKNGCPSAHS